MAECRCGLYPLVVDERGEIVCEGCGEWGSACFCDDDALYDADELGLDPEEDDKRLPHADFQGDF